MTIVDALTFAISGGPSREALFDALRLHPEGRKVVFEFSVREERGPMNSSDLGKFFVDTRILGIKSDEILGEKWMLDVQYSVPRVESLEPRAPGDYIVGYCINGTVVYSTMNRSGHPTNEDFKDKMFASKNLMAWFAGQRVWKF